LENSIGGNLSINNRIEVLQNQNLSQQRQKPAESEDEEAQKRSPKFSLVPKKLQKMMLKNQIKLTKQKFIKKNATGENAKSDY